MDGMDQTRDDAGQFTSSEEKFGRSAELADNGWTELEKPKEPELGDATNDELRDLADELAQRRAENDFETTPIVLTEHGEKSPDVWTEDGEVSDGKKTALSPEEAADALSGLRAAQESISDSADDLAYLESLGIDPVPPQIEQPGEQQHEQRPEATKDQQPSEQREADPVRDALQEWTKSAVAEQVRTEYAQRLNSAVALVEHSLVAKYPELNGVKDAADLNSRMQAIAHANPQRAQFIVNNLQGDINRAGQVVAEHKAVQAQQAQRDAAELASYRAQEGKAYEAKNGPVTEAQGRRAQTYLRSLGVTDQELAGLYNDRLAIDHRFQQVLNDAAAYHELRQTPPKAVPKTLPPVQRPGSSMARVTRGADTIASLNTRLNQTGSIDDAVALFQARRRG